MKKPDEIFNAFELRLKSISEKKRRVTEIVDFAIIYGDCFGVKIVDLLEEGIELSRQTDDRVGETLCYCNLAFTNRVTGVAPTSKYAVSLQELTKMVDHIAYDPESYVMGLNMLSYFHWFRGEYEKAFHLAFESLKHSGDKLVAGMGWNNFGLGVFYFDTKDYDNSIRHYQKAVEIFNELKLEYGVARAFNGLASIAIVQDRTQDALPLLERSAEIYREMGHYAGLSRAANDMGLLERKNGNYAKSVQHLKESIELRHEIDHSHGLITSYTELGETYLLMKDHTHALQELGKGIVLAVQLHTQQKQMRLHKLMYEAYKDLQITELALSHFEQYFDVKSQILSDEAANNIKRVQTRFETEKSEKEAELERFKNGELKKANTIIEQKNKDITDSINYARRIQLSILPPEENLNKCFGDYFVLYKPKDIVSGDFYWATPSGIGNVIAAIDCTGHGVPGAFMSIVGNTLLNQTISNSAIRSAADILNYLNQKLPENLKAAPGEQTIRDGMDMALCIFDFKNRRMEFAGANNPCWIVRQGQLIELKGDKQAITASTDSEKKSFTNQVFDLQKNDRVYLFTDGFADQFGGPAEKKFGYKQLRTLLTENSTYPSAEQKKKLDSVFEDWRNGLEQVDDVCIIGIGI